MKEKKIHTTTLQMTSELFHQMKMMCVLTEVSMGEFIRISIRDKIKQLNKKD